MRIDTSQKLRFPRFPIGSRSVPGTDLHKRFPRFPLSYRERGTREPCSVPGSEGVETRPTRPHPAPLSAATAPRLAGSSRRHPEAPRVSRAASRRVGRYPGHFAKTPELATSPRRVTARPGTGRNRRSHEGRGP